MKPHGMQPSHNTASATPVCLLGVHQNLWDGLEAVTAVMRQSNAHVTAQQQLSGNDTHHASATTALKCVIE
jgi:hypothetical protein